MKTIESIKAEIVKLNAEYHIEFANKNWGKAWNISDTMNALGERVLNLGYGFTFNWSDGGCDFSSSVIKEKNGDVIIDGSTLLSGRLEIDIKIEKMGIGRVFEIANEYGIDLKFDVFKI